MKFLNYTKWRHWKYEGKKTSHPYLQYALMSNVDFMCGIFHCDMDMYIFSTVFIVSAWDL